MSDDHNVVSLADSSCNGALWSPQQALEAAMRDVELGRGAFKGKRLLILALDDADGNYEVSFVRAGMRMSECLALCEVSKSVFLREMDY